MEREPWWKRVAGPFPEWGGPVGCKPDGGGCHAARGRVGPMTLHRAAHNQDEKALAAALAAGANPNEVEAAGTTPLHCAAYGGWEAGVRTLVAAGAKVAASNNAGDRAWNWAVNMGHEKVAAVLVELGSPTTPGDVIVQDHVPKVKDFFDKPCWAHHPKPYSDFMAWRAAEDARLEAADGDLLPSA